MKPFYAEDDRAPEPEHIGPRPCCAEHASLAHTFGDTEWWTCSYCGCEFTRISGDTETLFEQIHRLGGDGAEGRCDPMQSRIAAGATPSSPNTK